MFWSGWLVTFTTINSLMHRSGILIEQKNLAIWCKLHCVGWVCTILLWSPFDCSDATIRMPSSTMTTRVLNLDSLVFSALGGNTRIASKHKSIYCVVYVLSSISSIHWHGKQRLSLSCPALSCFSAFCSGSVRTAPGTVLFPACGSYLCCRPW